MWNYWHDWYLCFCLQEVTKVMVWGWWWKCFVVSWLVPNTAIKSALGKWQTALPTWYVFHTQQGETWRVQTYLLHHCSTAAVLKKIRSINESNTGHITQCHSSLYCLEFVDLQHCRHLFCVLRVSVSWRSIQRILPPGSRTGCLTCCPSRGEWTPWVDLAAACQCAKTLRWLSNFSILSLLLLLWIKTKVRDLLSLFVKGWPGHSCFGCWRSREDEHEEVWGDGRDPLPHQCCQVHGKSCKTEKKWSEQGLEDFEIWTVERVAVILTVYVIDNYFSPLSVVCNY